MITHTSGPLQQFLHTQQPPHPFLAHAGAIASVQHFRVVCAHYSNTYVEYLHMTTLVTVTDEEVGVTVNEPEEPLVTDDEIDEEAERGAGKAYRQIRERIASRIRERKKQEAEEPGSTTHEMLARLKQERKERNEQMRARFKARYEEYAAADGLIRYSVSLPENLAHTAVAQFSGLSLSQIITFALAAALEKGELNIVAKKR